LNAFTTPQFLAWLDEKMAPYSGKVVPPAPILEGRLDHGVRAGLRAAIEERVLAEARVDDRVAAALADHSARLAEVAADLPSRVADDLQDDPQRHWADVVADVVAQVVGEIGTTGPDVRKAP
jgi:hypothetical protein